MSKWTHVVGAIRLDAICSRANSAKKYRAWVKSVLGPMRTYGGVSDWFDATDEDEKNEIAKEWENDCRLPCGSEGSLEYRVIQYSEPGAPWVVIPIWGDLRDYDGTEEIEAWWEQLMVTLNPDLKDEDTKPIWVRDAVLHIYVESTCDTLILTETGRAVVNGEPEFFDQAGPIKPE